MREEECSRDCWGMEQIPLWWPAPFWSGPGGTGSCSLPNLRDTPLGSSQTCCLGDPRIAFPRGSIIFSRPPLGKWVFAAEQAERAPAGGVASGRGGGGHTWNTGMSSIPVVTEHWAPWLLALCAFGEQEMVPKPTGWHMCLQAPQSCSTRVSDSPVM